MTRTAVVSYRLGHADGVSVEAAKWAAALTDLGHAVVTVAGAGPVDRLVPGLAIEAARPPSAEELHQALDDADLVVVENVCSLPLNRGAAITVATALRGRPALLHHHDLPWQRPPFVDLPGFPPTDPAWAHVTVNHRSRLELAERGIAAVTIPNCFDVEAPPGDRERARRTLGLTADHRLLVQPTRAIPRKNLPASLRVADAIGAVFWLVGPAEDGYEHELVRVLADSPVPVIRGLPEGLSMADVYAAADAVALPSTWEGFGNPTVESAIHRRPLAVGAYPVAREIAAYGFRWFSADDPAPLREWLDRPDPALLDLNYRIARRHFSLASLRQRLAGLLEGIGLAAVAR